MIIVLYIKLNLYYNDGYNGYAGTIDNYSGTTLRYVTSGNVVYGAANQINSPSKIYKIFTHLQTSYLNTRLKFHIFKLSQSQQQQYLFISFYYYFIGSIGSGF